MKAKCCVCGGHKCQASWRIISLVDGQLGLSQGITKKATKPRQTIDEMRSGYWLRVWFSFPNASEGVPFGVAGMAGTLAGSATSPIGVLAVATTAGELLFTSEVGAVV